MWDIKTEVEMMINTESQKEDWDSTLATKLY